MLLIGVLGKYSRTEHQFLAQKNFDVVLCILSDYISSNVSLSYLHQSSQSILAKSEFSLNEFKSLFHFLLWQYDLLFGQRQQVKQSATTSHNHNTSTINFFAYIRSSCTAHSWHCLAYNKHIPVSWLEQWNQDPFISVNDQTSLSKCKGWQSGQSHWQCIQPGVHVFTVQSMHLQTLVI